MPASGGVKLQIRGVTKSFVTRDGGDLAALGPLDLEVREGEFICIVGPSGCGKSTLLNIVAGLDRPDTGEVVFSGHPVRGPGPDRLVLFQDLGLFPWLDVRRNVEFGLRLARVPRAERHRRALEQLRLVHLDGFERSRIHELSGGMRQRAALARALALEPEMLLMDEPFGALDAQTRDMLHSELQHVWARTGKTIFFVTHNVYEAACLGDRVVSMSRRPGRVKAILKIALPRPRTIENPEVARMAGVIREDLREEMA